MSKKAAVAVLQMTLLVILLPLLRTYSNIKTAAHSCRHKLPAIGAAAAPAAAETIISSWCTSTISLTSPLSAWLATQAQHRRFLLNTQAKTSGPQLLLGLWILAVTYAFKTDAQGCAASYAFTSLSTLTCIAADMRAATAVRQAAAAAASHILTVSTASSPWPSSSCVKLACAYTTAHLAAMIKWLKSSRSATSTVGLCLSSRGRQAMQACTACSKNVVAVMTFLVYIALGCSLMAGMMYPPGLALGQMRLAPDTLLAMPPSLHTR